MSDPRHAYRFTIRDLLIATAGLGVLLFIGKSWGVFLASSLTVTLVAGVLLIKTLNVWPIQTWRAPFAKCTILTCASITFPFICFFVFDFIHPGWAWYHSWRYEEYFVPVVFLVALLASTALIACYALLMMRGIRPLMSPLLLLFNFLFAKMIGQNLRPDFDRSYDHSDVLDGFLIALAILVVPMVVRWINRLPTVREEIAEECSQEETAPEK